MKMWINQELLWEYAPCIKPKPCLLKMQLDKWTSFSPSQWTRVPGRSVNDFLPFPHLSNCKWVCGSKFSVPNGTYFLAIQHVISLNIKEIFLYLLFFFLLSSPSNCSDTFSLGKINMTCRHGSQEKSIKCWLLGISEYQWSPKPSATN